jgi:hypothetical protein
MGIHSAEFDGDLRSPDTAQEILTVQYIAIGIEQLGKQPEFHSCEKDGLPLKADAKIFWIKNGIYGRQENLISPLHELFRNSLLSEMISGRHDGMVMDRLPTGKFNLSTKNNTGRCLH